MAHINIEILTALDIIVINGTQRDVNLHPHDITKTNKLSYIVFIFLVLMTPTSQLRLPHWQHTCELIIMLICRWYSRCHDVYPAYKYLCFHSEFTNHNWMEIKWVYCLNRIFFPGIVNRLKCEFTRATQIFAKRLWVRHGRTSILY